MFNDCTYTITSTHIAFNYSNYISCSESTDRLFNGKKKEKHAALATSTLEWGIQTEKYVCLWEGHVLHVPWGIRKTLFKSSCMICDKIAIASAYRATDVTSPLTNVAFLFINIMPNWYDLNLNLLSNSFLSKYRRTDLQRPFCIVAPIATATAISSHLSLSHVKMHYSCLLATWAMKMICRLI